MPPRIAIPMPHSIDREYSERAIPQYERAVELSGGKPVRIPLDRPGQEIEKIVASCQGLLLPGSHADVDPAKFKSDRSLHTAPADPRRDSVDELLLRDAYNLRKPILGICYGLQSLNVFRGGSLVQHIPDLWPEARRNRVNHEAGRKVPVAHTVEIEAGSTLEKVLAGNSRSRLADAGGESNQPRHPGHPRDPQLRHSNELWNSGPSGPRAAQEMTRVLTSDEKPTLPVNSSHHQSADAIGNDLRITARCPDDGIIEALEGTAGDHFVLAVQWHPERSVDLDEASRNIFRALIEAATLRRK
jgi:putative glutamine amidotransferase